MFWFWAPEAVDHLEIAAFYSLATGAGYLLMRRFRVSSPWSLLLVSPVVAYVVEGVITPVMYTGGPMIPVFPAWFAFWHGVLAFAGLVFGLRRLLLDRAIGALAAVAVGLGLFWGTWSSTLRLPENVNDEELIADLGQLTVLEPGGFGAYVVVFTAILIASHWLISFVWPEPEPVRTRPSQVVRGGEWLVGLLCLAGATGWTFVIPWALPMFLAYVGLQVAGLRWYRDRMSAPLPPTLLDQLGGRVSVISLAPLALMAPVAAGTYAVIWALDPSDIALRVVMYTVIAVQGVAGFVVTVMALRRARRTSGSAAVGDALRGAEQLATQDLA